MESDGDEEEECRDDWERRSRSVVQTGHVGLGSCCHCRRARQRGREWVRSTEHDPGSPESVGGRVCVRARARGG